MQCEHNTQIRLKVLEKWGCGGRKASFKKFSSPTKNNNNSIQFSQSFINLFCNVREFTTEVRAGALSIGEPFMHCEVTRSVTREVKTFNAVALADVNAKLDTIQMMKKVMMAKVEANLL